MAGFLNKLRRSDSFMSRTAAQSKAENTATEWYDTRDPRILYKISERARRISLKVKVSDRQVVVVVPGQRSVQKAQNFVQQQADWINVQLESLPLPQPFEPEALILLKGHDYQLIHSGMRGRPKINNNAREIYIPSPDKESFGGRVKRLLIREAREELEAATYHYANIVGKRVGKISVRDTSSRWGSCITRNGEGIINYSWRLISAPPFVLDYVAAHECAHLVHADHSPRFWGLCNDMNDDVKEAKAWLRKNGPLLHAVGAEH